MNDTFDLYKLYVENVRFNGGGDESPDRYKAPGDMTINQALGYPDDAPPHTFKDLLTLVSVHGKLVKHGTSIEDLDTAASVRQLEIPADAVETAIETKFQEYFVHAMAIPHQIDDFSELSKIVNLPEKIVSQKPKRRRRPTRS